MSHTDRHPKTLGPLGLTPPHDARRAESRLLGLWVPPCDTEPYCDLICVWQMTSAGVTWLAGNQRRPRVIQQHITISDLGYAAEYSEQRHHELLCLNSVIRGSPQAPTR